MIRWINNLLDKLFFPTVPVQGDTYSRALEIHYLKETDPADREYYRNELMAEFMHDFGNRGRRNG